MRRRGAGETDGTRACNIDGSTRTHSCRHRTVIPRGENVGQQRQVQDLRHRFLFVGELEQVEIGVGHHHVFGLAADPTAHIDVTVRRARTRRVHGQADSRLAFAAIPAAAAGDVERHGHEIADFQHLDIGALLDDFTGDFVSENESRRGGGPASDHMLVGATDVGGHDLQDHAMGGVLAAERVRLALWHP